MEQKKPTKKQLEKKLKEATVFVDKAEKSIYLAAIGVGIYISKFQTVLSPNFHRHVCLLGSMVTYLKSSHSDCSDFALNSKLKF